MRFTWAILILIMFVASCSSFEKGRATSKESHAESIEYLYCLHQPRIFLKYPIFRIGDRDSTCDDLGYFRATAHAFHAALRWHRLTVGYPGYELQFISTKLLTTFNQYTLLDKHKAFAVLALPSEVKGLPSIVVGAFAISNRETSLKAAIEAVETCEAEAWKYGINWICEIYSLDDDVVWKNRNLSPR